MNGKINMFLDDEQIERGTLRQGDIISQIHLLGAINFNSILYSSTAVTPKEYSSWSVPAAPKFGDAMVLSHSCEIALENKVKLTSIILAPLRDIHKATDKERVQELIDSNLIDQLHSRATFLKYFYVIANQKLEYSTGAVVDFSKLFSVRNQSYNALLEKKITQLSEETVVSMALKLSLYFHRTGFEEVVRILPRSF
jgi:hypothetical protein